MSETLRLLFPQWQGANSILLRTLVPDLKEPGFGYTLGSRMINLLVPDPNTKTATVPISMDESPEAIKTENGIFAYQEIKKNIQLALDILNKEHPKKVVTISGECSVSLAPFAYMAGQHKDDTALIWVDAHPDINLPGNEYDGFHAMICAHAMGLGDEGILKLLPGTVSPKNTLMVGLRQFTDPAEKLRKELGIPYVSCDSANKNPDEVINWIKQSGKTKILVHLDLDALEPKDLWVALGNDPNGLHPSSVAKLLNAISKEFDLVALTIAEPFPREQMKFRSFLEELPLK